MDISISNTHDIPNSTERVTTAGGQNVFGRMHTQTVDTVRVAVIVADHLVVLQVPALHRLILAAREQIRMPVAHLQTAHGRDVTGQRETQLAAGQIPDFDHSVVGAGGKPLVRVIDRQASHPAGVAGDHTHQFPWRVPLRPSHLSELLRLNGDAGREHQFGALLVLFRIAGQLKLPVSIDGGQLFVVRIVAVLALGISFLLQLLFLDEQVEFGLELSSVDLILVHSSLDRSVLVSSLDREQTLLELVVETGQIFVVTGEHVVRPLEALENQITFHCAF